MRHTTNYQPTQMPPELQETAYQSWLRTPEQQAEAEELEDLEWLRAIKNPAQRKWTEHQMALGSFYNSKPCADSNPFE